MYATHKCMLKAAENDTREVFHSHASIAYSSSLILCKDIWYSGSTGLEWVGRISCIGGCMLVKCNERCDRSSQALLKVRFLIRVWVTLRSFCNCGATVRTRYSVLFTTLRFIGSVRFVGPIHTSSSAGRPPYPSSPIRFIFFQITPLARVYAWCEYGDSLMITVSSVREGIDYEYEFGQNG